MTAGARALERLYAVAPRDFTRARNTLAAELRQARELDAAREVARLRRPSAPLWAVNQLARHARPARERFLDAVDRLRRTQLSDPGGAMEAMRAERVQLEALVQRAEQALTDVGYSPSAEARRRISDTLLGAAADRRHAEALMHGRLTEEVHAPGFDALTGATRLRVVQGGTPRRGAGAGAAARFGAAAAAMRPAGVAWVIGPGATGSAAGDALSDGRSGSGAARLRCGVRIGGRTMGSRTAAGAGREAAARSSCLARAPACTTSSPSRLSAVSTPATRLSAWSRRARMPWTLPPAAPTCSRSAATSSPSACRSRSSAASRAITRAAGIAAAGCTGARAM